MRQSPIEVASVINVFAAVGADELFVEVTEGMERFDAVVSSLDNDNQ